MNFGSYIATYSASVKNLTVDNVINATKAVESIVEMLNAINSGDVGTDGLTSVSDAVEKLAGTGLSLQAPLDKSNPVPSFLISAGAKLTVIFVIG